MSTAVTFGQLDDLTAELLPERSLMQVVTIPFNNAGAPAVVPPGTTMLSSCQAVTNPSPGLLAGLGVLGTVPSTSLVCTPGTIAH
jgi:hypothetical protein